MAGGPSSEMLAELRSRPGRNTWQAAVTRWTFITLSLAFLAALLIAPLMTVFGMAFSKGVAAYLHTFSDSDTRAAIRLTLLTAAIVHFEGIEDRDAAEAIEGAYFDVDPKNLPPLLTDEFDPLFGMEVFDPAGKRIGEIVDIRDNGSVDGDIAAPRVAIAEGAHFRGSIDMQRPGSKAEHKADVKPAVASQPATAGAAAAASR